MKQRLRTFCTVFPNYQDFHFFKDPGQIPYRFTKLGWDASVVCYDRGQDLPYTQRYLKVIKRPAKMCWRRFNLGIVIYLIFNARKIDVLHVFHLAWSSLVFIWFYKLFNRSGFAYLKLDDCVFSGDKPWEIDKEELGDFNSGLTDFKRKTKNRISRKFLIRKVDLWSIEDEYSREVYEERHPFMKGRIIVVYNGHSVDLEELPDSIGSAGKQDVILTVGRLGTFQKATDVLLEAFATVAGNSSYDLHLAGAVVPEFECYVEKYLRENPDLKDRIVFHGPLGREALYSLYSRSRIFCLPSRFDSLPNVFPEAMFFRNAIVTTSAVSLKYHIDKYGVGVAVKKDDPGALADALLRLINDSELLDRMASQARVIAETLLSWERIALSLQEEIMNRFKQLQG